MDLQLNKTIDALVSDLKAEEGDDLIKNTPAKYAERIQTALVTLKDSMTTYGGMLTEQTRWLNGRLKYVSKHGLGSQNNAKTLDAELKDSNTLASYALGVVSSYQQLKGQILQKAVRLAGRISPETMQAIAQANQDTESLVSPIKNAVNTQAESYAPLKKNLDSFRHAAGHEDVSFEKFVDDASTKPVFLPFRPIQYT